MISLDLFHKNNALTIGMAVLFIALFPLPSVAQEADTTRQEINLNEERNINFDQYLDRSITGGMLTEMGTYQVPEETQYYTPPFKGQYYLDLAVEAYRKELEHRIGDNWYWKFLKTISPYINNQFEFGVYYPEDMEFVDRDNPLFQSNNQ